MASACAAAAALAFMVISVTHQSGLGTRLTFHAYLSPITGNKGPTNAHPFSLGPTTERFLAHNCRPLRSLLAFSPGFNPATASDSQLKEYGFPPRPHGAPSDPAVQAEMRRWLKMAERAKRNPVCDHLPSTQTASLASLRRLALRLARLSGDPVPTSVEWLRTTRQLAVSSQDTVRVNRGYSPVYFVVVQGRFASKRTLLSGSGPKASTARAPRVTVLTFTADVRNDEVLDLSLGNRLPDYSRIGMPHHFTLESRRRRT